MDQSNPIPNVDILVEAEAGSATYQLSLDDFSFGEIAINNLVVPGVAAVEGSNGAVTLSRSGYVAGPTVPYLGANLPTRIYLKSGTVSASGQLNFVLSVAAVVPFLGEMVVTDVTFVSNETTDPVDPVDPVIDITGDYFGDLVVASIDPESPLEKVKDTIPGVSVSLNADINNKYKIDLSGYEIELGEIAIDQLTAVQNGEVVTLSRTEALLDTTVNDTTLNDVRIAVYFASGSITGNHLTFVLSVKTELELIAGIPVEMEIASFTFNGTKGASGFEMVSVQENNIILNTLVNNSLTALVKGEYRIYSVNGSVLQQGNVQADEINVSALKSGVYLINIGGKTAKFVKL
jgi:hypothetical protein